MYEKTVVNVAICFFAMLCCPSISSASSSAPDSVHFCAPFDYEEWRRDHPRPAAKRPADLNVGEPRTVRMIYFLPDDRPYSAEVVQDMKDRIREVQTFYTVSLQARGYGDKTFGFESDAEGTPIVHRVDGQHADSHYLDDTTGKVLEEIENAFDPEQNIYLVVIDNSTGVIDRFAGGKATRIGKTGGIALVTSNEMDPFNFHNVVSHELGHTFGLQHDFRDNAYVMSYGNFQESEVSACNAEFLAVQPYFNRGVPIEAAQAPAIELISPLTYPEGEKSVSVQLEVSDSDGLYQVILFEKSRGTEVKACRGLAGDENAVVTFDYNGVIPSAVIEGDFTSLSTPPRHDIQVRAVDTAGNVSQSDFVLSQVASESTLPRPQTLDIISGDDQQGATGSVLATPIVVEVRDQYGNPLPGAQVTFTVTAGEGRLSGRFKLENVTTDASGRAERILTLGPNPGTNAVEVSLGETAVETFHAVGHGEPVTPPSLDREFRTWHLPDGATARLGKGRLALDGRAVVFSPDGQQLAVATKIGVWLYDVAKSRPLVLLPAEKQITSLSFSPDGSTLAWSERYYFQDNIKLWDVATGELTTTISAYDNWVLSVAFSPDGKLLASGSLDNTIMLWDTETGRNVATYEGKRTSNYLDDPVSVSFSPDGKLLALGSHDRTIKLWDVATDTQVATLEGHTYPVASISFSPDGAILASGSWDWTIKLWDVATRINVATLEGHTDRVNSVTFSVDEKTLVSASSDGTIKLWDVATKENVSTLEVPTAGVTSVAFSRDGVLASGLSDGAVNLWDVSARGVVDELMEGGAVSSVAFSGDGTILALGYDDKTVRLWDAETGVQAATLEGHTSAVTSVAFLPDGTTLASGANQEIKLWQAPPGSGAFSLIADYFRPGCGIFSIVPSPDGTTIASGGPFEIVLWNLATQAQTAVASSTTTLSFSVDGKQLASKTFDGFINLWDVATLENTATIPIGHTSVDIAGGFVLFSPDGTMLATGSDYVQLGHIVGSVKLWDAVTKENIATFEEHESQIKSGAFSPDGTLLATGSFYGVIKLWDVIKKESVATLEGHAGSVESLSFSQDGTMLSSGSEDGTVLLWDIARYISPPFSTTDFDGDGTVGFSDFLQFAAQFGLSQGDTGYDARFDLDGDGAVGFSDFLIFAGSFGQ